VKTKRGEGRERATGPFGLVAGPPARRGQQAEAEGEFWAVGGKRSWALGPENREEGLSSLFSFPFFYSKSIFKSILKITLKYFWTLVKPLSTINEMQEHECTKMLLHPMINFN
jgi:hypothetical protein